MKTNKITATIVIEIEDDRDPYYQVFNPITKEVMEDHIYLKFDNCYPYHFKVKIKDIEIKESNPVTEEVKKYQESKRMIDDAMSYFYYEISKFQEISNSEFCDERYKNIKVSLESFEDEISNWNWRQDCSN